MARSLKDWLEGYLQYTDETEPPRSYHTWVGISLIASALKRRVWMRWGHQSIYPNLYVVLIGPSGRCRKGTAMSIGKEIVVDAGIQVTGESVIREQLIRNMAESVDSFTSPESGKINFYCSLYCMSPELAVFLRQKDIKFLSDLTDWYDCAPEWKYETKHQGKDQINGVCFNLLGATAADWLQSILPEEAVGGGFTSRIIFVVEEKKRQVMAEEPPPNIALRQQLIEDLQQMLLLCGPMEFTPEAKEAYMQWYTRQENLIDQGHMPVDDPRFGGYCDRRATHIKKIAMAMSASRGDSMRVTKPDFERGVRILTAIEDMMPRAFGGMGKSKYGDMTAKIIDFIRERGSATKSQILKTFYRDLDYIALDMIEKAMYDMHLITIDLRPSEKGKPGDTTYRWRKPDVQRRDIKGIKEVEAKGS